MLSETLVLNQFLKMEKLAEYGQRLKNLLFECAKSCQQDQ